jgi:LytR cell envelope-related transcriptional attenuator
MHPDLTLPLAALAGKGLLLALGGVAAILAALGMLLLVPIFVSQRREIGRLVDWMDREPDAGTRSFQAIPAPGATVPGRFGRSSAADRVTSERPALERVGTAEQQAIALERAPWWRRVVERGPRHPLVISLAAVLFAVAVFFATAHFVRTGHEGGKGSPVDPASVSVVVLNASTSSGLAGSLSDQLATAEFDVTNTSVAEDGTQKSVVMYSDASDGRREARAVAKALGISTVKPFDKEAEAEANGADVVVFAGDDLAKGGKG